MACHDEEAEVVGVGVAVVVGQEEAVDKKTDNHQNNGKSTPDIQNSVKIEIEPQISIPQDKNINNNEETRDIVEPENPTNLHFFSRYRGMLYALLSSFMFSLTSMLVKFLQERHSPITIALWRFQGAFLPALVLLVVKLGKERYLRKNQASKEKGGLGEGVGNKASFLSSVYPPKDKKRVIMLSLVLLRSILTCNALLLYFFSLKKLGMGDALVIANSTPVFVTLFAHYFLSEKCGLIPILSAVSTVIGVIVIVNPSHILGREEFDQETMAATFMALGSMLVATASYLVLRYIRKVHHLLTTLCFGGWGSIETAVLAGVLGVWSMPNCYQDWLAAAILASLTFVSQLAIILAMKCEKAGIVALVRTCDVVFGFVWQICVFDCWPGLSSWIGCSIVTFSLIVTACRKWVESLEDDDVNKKRFFFLLL